LTDLSEWHTGLPQSIDIVATVDSAALRWALRSFRDARFVSTPASGELPAIMITRQEELFPSLTASYRGQDFTWWLAPGWSSALPPNPVGWLTYHEAPVLEEQIILWARSDLFPGGNLLSQESP
jgi:hypothetical protein